MSHGCSHPRHKPSALIQKTAAHGLTFSRELLLMSEGRGKGERLSLIAAGSRGQCREPSRLLTQIESPLRLPRCAERLMENRELLLPILQTIYVLMIGFCTDLFHLRNIQVLNKFKVMLKIYLWIIIKGLLLSVNDGILK